MKSLSTFMLIVGILHLVIAQPAEAGGKYSITWDDGSCHELDGQAVLVQTLGRGKMCTEAIAIAAGAIQLGIRDAERECLEKGGTLHMADDTMFYPSEKMCESFPHHAKSIATASGKCVCS
jgi:hypothetical protein